MELSKKIKIKQNSLLKSKRKFSLCKAYSPCLKQTAKGFMHKIVNTIDFFKKKSDYKGKITSKVFM
jgi:hypothetical protein